MRKGDPALAQILTLLDEAFDRKSWHGTNLRGSLRRVTPAQAAWRPAAGRHNIHDAGQIQLLKRVGPRR